MNYMDLLVVANITLILIEMYYGYIDTPTVVKEALKNEDVNIILDENAITILCHAILSSFSVLYMIIVWLIYHSGTVVDMGIFTTALVVLCYRKHKKIKTSKETK